MASATEHKDRLIASLKNEVTELRQRERDYKTLQEQLQALETNFIRLTEEKRRMDEEYRTRLESGLVTVSSLRSEVDEQKAILTDKKKQNGDLYQEQERQKETLDQRSLELTRLRGDFAAQQDLHASLTQ